MAEKERLGVTEGYTAWASGRRDDAFGFAVGVTKSRCGEVANALYDLHLMMGEGHGYYENQRAVKDWAYQCAAEFAAANRVHGYRLDWGRQAARDGAALAMWRDLYGIGLSRHADQFKIGRRPFERVRDHVRDLAAAKINEFADELYANIFADG